MKLTELDPKLDANETVLVFDCPKCKKHKLRIPIEGKQKWNMTGNNYHDLTLTPSIAHNALDAHGCKSHFFITDGEIRLL